MTIHDRDTGGNLCQMQYGKSHSIMYVMLQKSKGMNLASLEYKTSAKPEGKPGPWSHQ